MGRDLLSKTPLTWQDCTLYAFLIVMYKLFPYTRGWLSISSVQLLSCVRLFAPHGLEHAKLTCPSRTPGACSNSCPSGWWCHPTTSFSVIPFSSWMSLLSSHPTPLCHQRVPGWAPWVYSNFPMRSTRLLCPGILQARILEWVANSFSRGSSLAQGSNPGLLHWRQML